MLPEPVFRAFGSVSSDINLDFINSPKIQVSLDLLSRCSEDPEFFNWILQSPGSERILALWKLVWASGKKDRGIEVTLSCQEPACKEAMALTFTEEELRDWKSSPSPDRDATTLQAPTSQDILRLLQQNPQQAMHHWLASKVNAPLTPEVLAQVGELLQQQDPLLSLTCDTLCPACGLQQTFSLDLEGMALRYLQGVQRELLRTVHQLAERYHWSEEQILALPAWRRNQYLQWLQRETRWT